MQTISECIGLISLDHVTKTYEEAGIERTVLDEVTLDLGCGEFAVLLGKSGTGKSTLLNLIGGIDTPTNGDVRIDGRSITKMSDHDRTVFRRENIGFIFQAFNLIPMLSVWENVLMPVELSSDVRKRKLGKERARNLLEQVGLGDRLSTYPERLSGGEQQRVAIARALSSNPLVVLADEPTGNLDADTGKVVLELLDQLTRKAGKNLVMVTHSEEVIGIADRVLHLKDGKIVG